MIERARGAPAPGDAAEARVEGSPSDRNAYPLLLRTAGPLSLVQRTALLLSGLAGLQRYGSAMLLGALAAAALPPVDLSPVLLFSFVGLVWLADGSLNGRSAFLLGWSFGFGFLVAGLYWIGAALLVDIAQFWWLMPFAVLGLPAGLAIYSGGAVWLSHTICQRFGFGGTSRILILALCWSVAEWLRGHLLTGFPWNLVGYAWSGAFPGALAMLQSTGYVGIYGLSLITVLAASLPARLGDLAGARRWPAALAALLIAVPAGAGAWRLSQDDRALVAGVSLRLVQPSIPQTLKNDPAAEAANFRRLLALSATPAAAPPKIIIWPEAAAPPLIERRADVREAMAGILPPGGLLITGGERAEPLQGWPPQHFWNSVLVLDDHGAIIATYDKAHLVPFGEYMPLRGILPIDKIAPSIGDFSTGPGPRTLSVAGVPPFGPLICYEAIFPAEVTDTLHRPGWLLNVTNDAWYGFTSGPFQHLAIARTRAVEEGLPLVRVGNNGISAVIDPYGRVFARLDLDVVGALDSPLPAALPATLYARVADGPYAGLLIITAILALLLSRRDGRSTAPPS